MNIATLIMEIIVWCRLVLTPLLVGCVLGGIAYLGLAKPYGLIVAGVLLLASLLVGIRMAGSFAKMQQEMHPDAVKKAKDENRNV